eukprot:550747_1
MKLETVKSHSDMISRYTNRYCNFYGHILIKSTAKIIHRARWKFRINKQHTVNNICIGIEEGKENNKDHIHHKLQKDYYFCLTDQAINYGYHDKYDVYNRGKMEKYGSNYLEGSVIEMELDLSEKEPLSFKQNG